MSGGGGVSGGRGVSGGGGSGGGERGGGGSGGGESENSEYNFQFYWRVIINLQQYRVRRNPRAQRCSVFELRAERAS